MDAPNIAQYFPHLQERVMPHSLGQPVLSDWADMPDTVPCSRCGGHATETVCPVCFDTGKLAHPLKLYKNCGFLNRDEAAILYQCAKQIGGTWLDIGGHTGWTALHIAHGTKSVVEVLDPMYAHPEFKARAQANVDSAGGMVFLHPYTSKMYFETMTHSVAMFNGIMIDGDHCWMNPLYDAVHAFKHLPPRGVILLHDFIGGPVREATKYLMCERMKCRVYCASSQLLAVCWRGEFTPPDYTPDPKIDWQTVLTPLAATKLVGFKDGKAIADPAATQASGDFYFELCS